MGTLVADFLALVDALRARGAVEVQHGEMRVRFSAPARGGSGMDAWLPDASIAEPFGAERSGAPLLDERKHTGLADCACAECETLFASS